ncbi:MULTISPECIES: hypothetical protein [Maricaulis]|uniref:Uncharacterized protein n=1 Tax=Maricaulis maris (strain MCS10) TaxID=394221 RepID=Q0ALM1_MARMM|nr:MULTISPECIES: hypothetical protein [Maricaulis]ABI66822.1 hypothetical protein Mmar10_2536 [Maricaulis maris MCS10]MAC88764.1 hypothetical protein [Maricaulis sp.]
MVRKIDEKKTRRALRRLERARKAAVDSGADTPDLSEWEGEFLGSLEERLEKFGSAFNDPDKGNTDDALSARQALKLREIEKKAKGKARKPMSRGNGFKRKAGKAAPRSRDIHDDLETPGETSDTPPPDTSPPTAAAEARRAGFRVIEGGAADGED